MFAKGKEPCCEEDRCQVIPPNTPFARIEEKPSRFVSVHDHDLFAHVQRRADGRRLYSAASSVGAPRKWGTLI